MKDSAHVEPKDNGNAKKMTSRRVVGVSNFEFISGFFLFHSSLPCFVCQSMDKYQVKCTVVFGVLG
jgi:hypothetical protein